MPEEAIKHADSVIMGFAENTWPQLLRDLKEGRMKRLYNATERLNLANIPFPRRDLLKKDGYLTINTIMATRGCPNRCRFCTIPVARQGKYYRRPVEDVIEEIKFMEARKLIFLDPSPTEDINYAKELYKAMVPLGVKWVGLTTTKIVQDEELLDYEHVVFKPAKMSPEELQKGVNWIWEQTYTFKNIFKRICRLDISLWEVIAANFGLRHHAKQLSENGKISFVGE